jgi:hypothetical protein
LQNGAEWERICNFQNQPFNEDATGTTNAQFAAMYRIPTYESWLKRQETRPVYQFHRRFLQHLQYGRPARRFVLKAPCHMLSMEALFAAYPDALVVQTHREPLEQFGYRRMLPWLDVVGVGQGVM